MRINGNGLGASILDTVLTQGFPVEVKMDDQVTAQLTQTMETTRQAVIGLSIMTIVLLGVLAWKRGRNA